MPVRAGLALGALVLNSLITFDPLATKLPLTVRSTAVAAPVKAGLSLGAFKPNSVIMFVVPTNKFPPALTVKLAAVGIPVKAGLANGWQFRIPSQHDTVRSGFRISELSKYVCNVQFPKLHMTAAVHVLRYLRGTAGTYEKAFFLALV